MKPGASDDEVTMIAVRTLRRKLGISQTELAALTGVTINTVLRWETIRPPIAQPLVRLMELAKTNQLFAHATLFQIALARHLGITTDLVLRVPPSRQISTDGKPVEKRAE